MPPSYTKIVEELENIRKQQADTYKQLRKHMLENPYQTVEAHKLMKVYIRLCQENDRLDRELGEASQSKHEAQNPLAQFAFHVFGDRSAAAPRKEERPRKEEHHAATPRKEEHRAAEHRKEEHRAATPRKEEHRAAAPRKEEHRAATLRNPMRTSSHSPEQLHCSNFHRVGGCTYGDKCKFKHASKCRDFKSSTGCKYGVLCHFSHHF